MHRREVTWAVAKIDAALSKNGIYALCAWLSDEVRHRD